jgi:hypothetical protein
MKKICFLIVFTIAITNVFADTPLTETSFYKAYLDVPMVEKAIQSKGIINNEILVYLCDSNPLDLKIAVINALGWNHKKSNSTSYLNFVLKTKKYTR